MAKRLPVFPHIHFLLNADIVKRGKPITRENIMSLRAKFTMNILDGVFKFLVLYIKQKKEQKILIKMRILYMLI